MVCPSVDHYDCLVRALCATNFMKIQLTIFGLLFLIFTFSDSFSQQKLSKDEILKEVRINLTKPSIDSIFRWDIHSKTRIILDNLFKEGIDTLVVYSVIFPGHMNVTLVPLCTLRTRTFFGRKTENILIWRLKDIAFHKLVLMTERL